MAPPGSQAERRCFTALVAVMLAPVVAQGLDRPLASLLGGRPSGADLTAWAIAVALVGWLVATLRASAAAPIAYGSALLAAGALAAALGLDRAGGLALVAVAGGAVALSRWLPARLPSALDGLAARHRVAAAVYTVLALASVAQVGRVSVFIADPTRLDAQVVPGIAFLETHSCLTAYVRGMELAHARVDNLYRADRWPDINDRARPADPQFGPFDVDAYFYPPAFLLFAEVLSPWRGDFLAQRAAWFGIQGLLIALALWVGARRLAGPRWHRPLLLSPLFFASLPVLVVLQIGNAQAAVVVVAVLAMWAVEAGRPALGGFGLAVAALAKLSPGILVVVLIAQRRWRAVMWTAAAGAALMVVALLLYGPGPIEAFVTYMLPRLSAGEAFAPMLRHRESVALNLAPGGLPFRLGLLGVDIADPWRLARGINRAMVAFVIAFALVVARRHRGDDADSRGRRALAWFGLLHLAALCSSFAPGYVMFAFAWAITLFAVEARGVWSAAGLVAVFLVATVLPPLPLEPLAAYLSVAPLLSVAVAAWWMLRRPPAAGLVSPGLR